MNEPLHIHVPCDDDGIQAIEQVLGVKFQRVFPSVIPTELVDVCPMDAPVISSFRYPYCPTCGGGPECECGE